jgi:hypothetical protein
MKRLLLIILALSCLAVAQTRRIPSLPVDNIPVADNDAVTKKYVDDRTPPTAANGTNCAAGEFPKGVDQFGNVEDCTPIDTTTDLTWPLVTNTANPATVGQFRLAYADQIAWRNALNTANYTLNPDADGNLVWSGNGFLSSGSGASYWEGSVGVPSVASAGKGRISFSSTGNRPVWSYDGGANVNILLAGDSAGSAATADALTNNPTDCAANQFANAIDAEADLTCAAITDAAVPDNITINLAAAATALAANPTDCSASQFATGIDASGNLTCAASGSTSWLDGHPDKPPTSPTSYDDEFDDTSGNSGTVNGLNARWTWVNQGTSTLTYGSGRAVLTPQVVNGTNIRAIMQGSLPSLPFDMTCKLHFPWNDGFVTFQYAGMAVRHSGGDDWFLFGIGATTSSIIKLQSYTGPATTGPLANGVEHWEVFTHFPEYFKIRLQGTDAIAYVSEDGITWRKLRSMPFGTAFAGNTPDQIGVWSSPNNNVAGPAPITIEWCRRTS